MYVGDDINIWVEKLKDFNINNEENWAIYGTGGGATVILKAMEQMSLIGAVKFVLDNDDKVVENMEFHGKQVKKLSDVCNQIDGIIIAACDNHEIIKKRIETFCSKKKLFGLKIINIFAYNTSKEITEYVNYIEKTIKKEKTDDFVEFNEKPYRKNEDNPRVIAWYLPQYHQIDINNKFHGQGFTEWTNTTRTIPIFTGHYQPHIPYDVGYYDLNDINTFERQIYLAKHYGVTGFCFHYYWFSGKQIMEKPLQLFLKHKELDMQFCIHWANENWTALWDGGENEMMFKQELEESDDDKFMQDVLPFMKDTRYMKIDGKPILIIYRANIWSQQRVVKLLENFRRCAQKAGFPDLYIMLTNAREFEEDVEEWGADALVEFPPHVVGTMMEAYRPKGYINPYFYGWIKSAQSFIEHKSYFIKHKSKKFFRSALTAWDNTARKATSGSSIYVGLNPQTFKTWISDIINESKKIHSADENIVFINSWNEWAEGSHLEPDMKYGYAYLQALKDALEESK